MGLTIDRKSAEETFRKALQLAPRDSDAMHNFGWFLCQDGDTARAMQLFNNAIKNPLYQTPEKSWVNSGLCAMRLRDYKSAADYLHKAHRPGRAAPTAAAASARPAAWS